MPPDINRFTGTYAFLSNFSAATVTLDEEEYPTVEHAFQAAKTADVAGRQRIRQAPTPGQAKRLGRHVALRPAWESIKIPTMRALLCQKFSPGRKHLEWLLDTGDATLIEGNTWGDTFWGVCEGKGLNHLGQLLMEIRHLRRQELDAPR